MINTKVKRVRVELELDDGSIKHVEYTDVVDFQLDMTRELRETTWEQVNPGWRTFEPGPYAGLNLTVSAMKAERSA